VGDPDTLTNVAFGIAADFRKEKGADVTSDAQAMRRIALAYLDSLEVLWVWNSRKATRPDWGSLGTSTFRLRIHVPSLTTAARGPLDFDHYFTLERLRELAATPAVIPEHQGPETPVPPPPAAAAPASAEPPPAKQSWWKKIFG
jgi:hypothetical protein